MEFATEIGLFLAKLLAVLLTTALIIGGAAVVMMRSKMAGEDHLEVNDLNRKYRNMALTLQHAMLPKKLFKQTLKEAKQAVKEKQKQAEQRQNIYVIDFKGDIRASQVASLREEISAILQVAGNGDEVVVLVESGGGTVHGYGLAASQLKRVRDHGINLTVAIDKVAASGGYMMACVGNRIIAAPFAIVGSVGVLGQLPNFHRFLKKRDIDFEQVSAGEYKRTLTLFGENTPEDRERFRQELEDTHELFKSFVKTNRPQVDIDKIATGEHWYGARALELNLVDDLKTSDDYLAEAVQSADLYQVKYVRKKPFIEKIFGPALSQLRDYELIK
ncbi:MAG: protease SohB [Gammaproteobacteria bacterium]|nr:protease SohB [Gammaproteobacteria bacterium]